MLKKMKNSQDTTTHDLQVAPQFVSTGNTDMDTIINMMEKLLHWAAIIESTDDAIISKSIEGIITSWNKGAEKLYGYTSEEIVGKPISVLMPPGKKDEFPLILKQLRQGKKIEHFETQRVTKDGTILHVSITVSPIRDTRGNIVGASKIARDVSDRVELEKRRDDFISTTSHELKTPITSQKIFGELLEKLIDKNGDTQYKAYIQKINLQTQKLNKLIEDLLDLSRAQSGRLIIENKKFSLTDLISEIIENTQQISSHQIMYQKTKNIYVKGDKERIGQVITNLLSNAIKYSPKASKVIVSTRVDQLQVTTGVQDFGIGIDKKHQHKVFERFYRVSGGDEKTYPGMGIGLHLCQEIILRHKGKLWVESQKGKGSTFYFTLPLTK